MRKGLTGFISFSDHPYYTHNHPPPNIYHDTRPDFAEFEPYLPLDHPKKPYRPDKEHWGINRYGINNHHKYLPPKVDAPNDWGVYNHRFDDHKHVHNYWGVDRYGDDKTSVGVYLPLPKPRPVGSYLPRPNDVYLPKPDEPLPPPGTSDGGYLPLPRPPVRPSYIPVPSNEDHYDNSILPAEPRRPAISYNFIRDGIF